MKTRKCFLTIETDDEEGYGPFTVRSTGVSPQMLIVLRRAMADMEEELMMMIQNPEITVEEEGSDDGKQTDNNHRD